MDETLITHEFAILAAVPEEHLLSWQQDGQETKVAFGSMDFELFRQADALRGNKAVEVFIYASLAENRPLKSEVSWHGLYVSHVQSRSGRYPQGMKYRPPSTASDKPTWAIFWEVEDLKPLSSPIAIASLRGLGKKSNYQSRFTPEGPLLITYP
ncbi:MAG: hypothetical protein LDL41_02245 [Coleofasciculus sp. S288]|nr:hypothetical protein [Coleofasciculus sp. S288]